jgi:hypothetical protein
LPNLAGFGNVHSLHQALALDTTGKLQTLLEQVITTTGEIQDQALTLMIYQWAGVIDNTSNARISKDYSRTIQDGRKLEAIEEFMGQKFLGRQHSGAIDKNLNGKSAPIINQAFNDLKDYIKDKLANNTNQSILDKIRVETDANDNISAIYIDTFINYLNFEYADNPQEAINYLIQIKTALATIGTIGKQVLAALEQAGDTNGNELAQILARDLDKHLVGSAGNDVLVSGSGYDTLKASNTIRDYYFDKAA